MTKPFISIAMLTRNNLPGMIDVFHSYIDNCKNTDDVEFLVGQDEDDGQCYVQFKEYQKDTWPRLNFKYVTHESGRDWENLYKSWNELYQRCTGEWLNFASDDCHNITEHWDQILREEYKGKFVHLRAIVHPGADHPSALCPYTPKKYIDLMGHLGLNTQWDEWTSEIARDLGFFVTDERFQFQHQGPFRSTSKYTGQKYLTVDRPLWMKDKQRVKDYLDSLNDEKGV